MVVSTAHISVFSNGVLGSDAAGNTIVDNTTKNNLPFDLAYDGLGTGDLFGHNQCNTSTPPGLCSADREN